MTVKCERCDDTRWVCEAHDTAPWRDCDCEAPGITCPDCNATAGPHEPPRIDPAGVHGHARRQGAAELSIGCESSVVRKQSTKLGGSHDGISTNSSTRNVTTKPVSAAATSQRTLSDIGLHLMRPIIKRAPTDGGKDKYTSPAFCWSGRSRLKQSRTAA
jgi:hypothetical protein